MAPTALETLLKQYQKAQQDDQAADELKAEAKDKLAKLKAEITAALDLTPAPATNGHHPPAAVVKPAAGRPRRRPRPKGAGPRHITKEVGKRKIDLVYKALSYVPMSPPELAKRAKTKTQTANALLCMLVAQGAAKRTAKGLYTHADGPQKAFKDLKNVRYITNYARNFE